LISAPLDPQQLDTTLAGLNRELYRSLLSFTAPLRCRIAIGLSLCLFLVNCSYASLFQSVARFPCKYPENSLYVVLMRLNLKSLWSDGCVQTLLTLRPLQQAAVLVWVLLDLKLLVAPKSGPRALS
jgi:hypothetical protein